MATPHTLNLASPGMARICLYGDLQRFGRRIDLSINSAAEGLHALFMQIPEFRQKLNEGWYQVRISGQDIASDEVTARLHEPLLPGAVIHIVPRAEGAKSGWGGIILGGILVAASFIPGLNAMVATAMLSFGISATLGGVAQLLTPKVNTADGNTADNGKQSTYFSSLENMIAQGNPMPVPYGEIMVGSRRISQTLSTRDESSPEKVINYGGPFARYEELMLQIAGLPITKPRVIVH
ncbi:TPA: tail assembly protein [Escherichia coli]|nr:tail assembly protein [Escherichia coli]DAM44275.1 MAG TPA: tail assembly protein [Caudoviricetes sp.]HAU8151911.1 tail assembly protein [Escherichia coli]HAW0071982.1 tail assembly protein [Escherichia coli]HBD3508715.1 tail assembly protein [Escherichia coli]HBE4842032.1 tail assembly protein [Escherichia coli]